MAPAMAQQMLHQSPSDIPQNAQDRCTYILNRLVQKGGSLNLYDLCDEIYISATTFHGLMGKMRPPDAGIRPEPCRQRGHSDTDGQ